MTPSEVSYHAQLKLVDGFELEVETEHLFTDQFNTSPIEGVSELGMRILHGAVAEVIDDERPGKMKCGYCGKHQAIDEDCMNCVALKDYNRDFLRPFLYGFAGGVIINDLGRPGEDDHRLVLPCQEDDGDDNCLYVDRNGVKRLACCNRSWHGFLDDGHARQERRWE